MKNLFKSLFIVCGLIAATTTFTSCDTEGNEILRQDPENPTSGSTDPEEVVYDLKVNPNNEGNLTERNIIVTKPAGEYITVNANFAGNENMYRLYMTKHVIGDPEGAQPFEYALGEKKSDGSIDLQQQDKQEFTYTFEFQAPETDGRTVQYVLWVTTGRGDFRDINKRNAIADNAVGVITIKAGAESENVTSSDLYSTVKSFSAKLLFAPTADQTSISFMSIYNGESYQINQSDELVALWDFGYFFGSNSRASFASTYNYPSDVIDVAGISGVTKEDLNHFYIKQSSLTTSQFDAITDASELDFITQPNSERVTGLTEGDVLEFVDTYGNKGLIKVTKIQGTYNQNDYIEFDVKVSESVAPFQG